jgi:hypothetical protein
MELRYRGFNQNENTRTYKFDAVSKGESAVEVAVTVDMALFLKHHIGIQEGPALCAQKVTADTVSTQKHDYELTNEYLLAFANARAANEARKAAARQNGARHRRPAPTEA